MFPIPKIVVYITCVCVYVCVLFFFCLFDIMITPKISLISHFPHIFSVISLINVLIGHVMFQIEFLT